MKIVILDAKTLGKDLDLSLIDTLGEVEKYELTTKEEVASRIQEAEVILTNKVVLGEQQLKNASKVRFIGLFATGYNNIDLDYAKARGIAVANVAGYSTKSVAQHTFALLFGLLEQINFYDHYVKTKAYAQSDTFSFIERPFWEINNKTWGIIGMGAIGEEVAQIAQAFGARVQYYSTSGKNNHPHYTKVDLETLLKTSDVVSIHAPLNNQTLNLLTYDNIKLMKKESILLNLGRGGIVHEEDLAQALEEDLIKGAGLDVLVHEPIVEDHPLYKVKDASKWLVTPHIAWASIEARQQLIREVVGNIQAFLKGESRNRLV